MTCQSLSMLLLLSLTPSMLVALNLHGALNIKITQSTAMQ